MSSSSLYEPEEDEEASDSDIESRRSQSKIPPSSPLSYDSRRSPSSEPDRQRTPNLIPRASRGSRAQALEDLRISLGKEPAEAYANVLAETTGDINTIPTDAGGESYNTTQNGIVVWTSKEKEALYNVLDRKGRNGVQDISHAIGSKSELEVQEHLKLLHKGVERQHLKDRHSRTVILGDVPAASEISKKCCRALDDYAHLLSLEEQQAEDIAGRQKHHDVWIIDREVAEEVDEQIQAQGDGLGTGSSVYLTAGLLNMKKWIRLSERFFMNAGGPRLEDNWANIAFADETPAMTADAFADFYALTVSVTRRLVHSALFFAMSRLRNMRETGNRKAQVVRSRDVRTALDVLNMKRDRFDFWVGMARRCSLEVADLRHKKGWNSMLMDYDEVEELLSDTGKVPIDTPSRGRSVSSQRLGSELQNEDVDGELTTDNYDSESEVASSISSVLSSPETTPIEELGLDHEDEHAERVDQKNSGLEEQQLWELMKRPAPTNLSNEEQNPKRRKPTGERKTKEDLVDWRDRTLYRSDWEEYGHEIYDLYEEISETRRKRRRLDRHVAIRESSVSSDSEMDAEMDDYDEEEVDLSATKNEQDNGSDGEHERTDQHEYDNEDMELETTSIIQNPELVIKPKDLNPNQDESSGSESESGSEFESDDESNPNQNPQLHQEELKIEPREEGAESDSGSDASSHADDDGSEDSDESSKQSRRYRVKVEPKKEHEALSSGSDNDLPLNQHPKLDNNCSSSEEDEKNNLPLYSQPMSPVDWRTD